MTVTRTAEFQNEVSTCNSLVVVRPVTTSFGNTSTKWERKESLKVWVTLKSNKLV